MATTLEKAVGGLLEFFVGSAPPRRYTMKDYAENPHLLNEAVEKVERREEALDHMSEDIDAGRNISIEDLRQLTREDLENIKAGGDDQLRAIIRDHTETKERSTMEGGRERER